jgi:hypothetical protein
MRVYFAWTLVFCAPLIVLVSETTDCVWIVFSLVLLWMSRMICGSIFYVRVESRKTILSWSSWPSSWWCMILLICDRVSCKQPGPLPLSVMILEGINGILPEFFVSQHHFMLPSFVFCSLTVEGNFNSLWPFSVLSNGVSALAGELLYSRTARVLASDRSVGFRIFQSCKLIFLPFLMNDGGKEKSVLGYLTTVLAH